MDISAAVPIMRQQGVSEDFIAEIREAAAKIPAGGMLSWGATPVIAGLNAAESELLLIRMLERLAERFDAKLSDHDVPELVGLPSVDELLGKVSNPQAAVILRDAYARLGSGS
jgi:hypothetical protein